MLTNMLPIINKNPHKLKTWRPQVKSVSFTLANWRRGSSVTWLHCDWAALPLLWNHTAPHTHTAPPNKVGEQPNRAMSLGDKSWMEPVSWDLNPGEHGAEGVNYCLSRHRPVSGEEKLNQMISGYLYVSDCCVIHNRRLVRGCNSSFSHVVYLC